MDGIVYSEKEIAIFNGIIALMEKGVNPYSIKVSDIAREADIGKGTIYDYFTSKEEAISQAILYNINREVDIAYSRIRQKKGFKGKFYEALHIIAQCAENNVSTLKTLLSLGGIQKFYEYLSDYKCDLSDYVSRLNQIYHHLLATGVGEGVIDMVEDPYYHKMAMTSAIMGFSQYFHQREFWHDVTMEEAMEASYKFLIKALN